MEPEVAPAPELDLIRAAQAGAEPAFEQLIRPYRRELLAHCYRLLGSPHDAEDALQESLLAAWRGLGGFQHRSSLRTWLYRITTHAGLRLSSQRARRLQSPDAGPARHRTLIVSNIISRDGFSEGPGRNVMALPMDDVSFDLYNAERLRSAQTPLLGATTYGAAQWAWS